MNYNVEVKPELVPFIEKSALADNVSVEVWLGRKLNGNVRKILKDSLIESITVVPVEDIERIKVAVEAEKAVIESEKPPAEPPVKVLIEELQPK